MNLINQREQVAAFMRRLYKRYLTTATGGNVSMRVDSFVLITPSQIDKATLTGEDIVILDLKGNDQTGNAKKSMETGMHLAIYAKRPDVKAIVHAHPVFATSFAITGKQIKTNLAGEARAMLGDPELADYALMGTQKLANLVAKASLKSNVILMRNHGVITLGDSLFQAFDRMEVLEACSKMTLITDIMGGREELSTEQLKEIDNLFS